ncbi:MAG: cyclic pyranopterin monophosphate synthase MoaC [Phycisphaerae bacterium]
MAENTPTRELSHVTTGGVLRMVDVSEKAVTRREAVASAEVAMRVDVLDALMADTLPKGDAIAAARLAGIMAAKRTGAVIPLCHPLDLDWVGIEFERLTDASGTATGRLVITCTCRATARTGVEMEALTGVSVAALTVYDMAKAGDRGITIGPIRLERKTGGRGGPYTRGAAADERTP